MDLTEVEGVEVNGDQTTVEEALSQLDGQYLDCRDMRHAWEKQGYWTEGGFTKRRLDCARCGTKRVDTWSRDGGERVGVNYEYPDGYLLQDADGHARPMHVRAEVVSRATVYQSEHEMVRALMRRARSNGKAKAR